MVEFLIATYLFGGEQKSGDPSPILGSRMSENRISITIAGGE